MKIFKQSQRVKPKVSLILLDWSVRESFHLLHYLSLQTIPREQFEVVIVEYYSRHSEAIKKFEEHVDTWIALEMPEDLYYHKHLMYNAGIVASTGEICIICDSDAMAKPTFLESVIKAFEQEPNLILHLDQFRNNRKDLYPFCYPSFEDVTGPGCINITNGKTTGLAVTKDLIHNRNYGACFCAKREDLIEIGGADEHIDFIGHICGPYDFTFRLMNIGKKEVWHGTEFLYHTWHPGQAGENNYLGPHDGRHVSTTSLEALTSNRVLPHVINPAILKLQKDNSLQLGDLEHDIILPCYEEIAKMSFLMSSKSRDWAENTYIYILYQGWMILKVDNGFKALPISDYVKKTYLFENKQSFYINDTSLNDLKIKIDKRLNTKITFMSKLLSLYFWFLIIGRVLGKVKSKILTWMNYVPQKFSGIRSKNKVKILTRENQTFQAKHRVCSKLNNIRKENHSLKEDMYTFLLNLNHYMKKKSKNNPILLVSNLAEYKILSCLMALKLIPNLSIFLVNQINLNAIDDTDFFISKQTFIQNLDVFLNNKINPVVL